MVRTAGILLEEEVSSLLPDVTYENPADLMQSAYSQHDPDMNWGFKPAEQRGIMFLYAGAILALRNPMSHRHPDTERERYLDDLDRTATLDILCFFNFLLQRLEQYGTTSLEQQVEPNAEEE